MKSKQLVASIRLSLLLTSLLGSIAYAQTDAVWNPLNRQERRGDTLFLLDAEAERIALTGERPPGRGGLMNGSPITAGVPAWDGVIVTPGKYRPGLQSVKSANGFVWMPLNGAFDSRRFTVECWIKCSVSWDKAATGAILSLGDSLERGGIRLTAAGKTLRLQYSAAADPRYPLTTELVYDLAKNPLPADDWRSVAFTFADGTLRLYVDGVLVKERTGLVTMSLLPDKGIPEGLSLLGRPSYGLPQFALSDLRISRAAFAPGQEYPVGDGANVVTLYPDEPTGEIVRQSLLGGLHTLRGKRTEEMAAGVVHTLRTDKLLTATPIKAGSPDAAHPSRGISGKYSYDWQVADRTFDYFRRRRVTPYISLDSTPQILGGDVPPFSGQPLREWRAYASGFSNQAPSDMAAFGDMVRDLVYHVVKEKKYDVPYWGVWNEPDESGFWTSGFDRYLTLYSVCARAVKSVDPALKIGGPETANFQPALCNRLAAFCMQQNLPLDFLSWHFYSGAMSDIGAMRQLADALSKEYGLPKMALINGEWCWNTAYLPGHSRASHWPGNSFLNDWHAAFVGASLIEMQKAGVVYGIYVSAVTAADAQSFGGSGLMSDTAPWANLNVFRLWTQLYPQIVRSDYDGVPGVYVQASRNDKKHLTVLLSSWRYRGDTETIQVTLPPGYSPSRIRLLRVDDQNADAYDAGRENAELRVVQGMKYEVVAVRMKPRSVVLLVIEPIGKGGWTGGEAQKRKWRIAGSNR